MTKFGLERLTGKALSVCLEFIDETGEKFFVYKCKLSLSLVLLHPRRPRGSQSGWEKRRDESFQVFKNALYYCANRRTVSLEFFS